MTEPASAATGLEPHRNDPELIRRLLTHPANWAIVGLSNNPDRAAYPVAAFIRDTLGMPIVAVHPRAEETLGVPGFRRLADVPEPIAVVDCFVNSRRVGGVVDDAIAEKDRLGIRAIWMQMGVIDEEAAARAKAAGIGVVMDTCPVIEARRLRSAS